MNDKPIIYVDMDGVVADFDKGYADAFGRDVYGDDSFTITQHCLQVPHFFRFLSVLGKGAELVDLLRDDYKIVFLTTPMQGMEYCRRDKLNWVREHFGDDHDVIFSNAKADYVVDESSILIDDMERNLKPWTEAGGTAINIKLSIDQIFEKIEEVIFGKETIAKIKNQLTDMVVNTNPTEKQKESGNYKKGDIIFKKLKIKIENPKGSIRFGFDRNGYKWVQRMKAHYGYICGKNDAGDGDKVDVFIGPNYNKSLAFVVNQNTEDNRFDEHKVILGCNDMEEARKLYLANYQKGWESRIGSITQTNTKQIRNWIETGNLNEPFK
jgi:5'(3')-deoxyribonucleotidase